MIRSLPWDSRHFGLEIGRVEENTLNEATAREVADERGWFDCVYLLADADHVETGELAHELGFRMVDVRITLARSMSGARDAIADDTIRDATASDLPRMQELAAASYRSTRFYFDRRFKRDRVDEMYRIWIANESHNAAAKVFVVDDGTGPAGYMSCSVRNADSEIGLVAISEATRGTGKALALMERSLGWAAACGAVRITVVTQGRNVAALRLYERAGFRVQNTEVWYHLWR
jgi:ribosomal protein S18 acetylase RimI-like enzyme